MSNSFTSVSARLLGGVLLVVGLAPGGIAKAATHPPETADTASASASLIGIQGRIAAAFAEALRARSTQPLDTLAKSLDGVPVSSAQAAYYRGYWLGYSRYHEAMVALSLGRQSEAKTATEAAIAALEGVEPADREAQALLALATGLNLAFVSQAEMMSGVARSTAHLRQAMEGSAALRPLYVAAVLDWNTPAEFGGKAQAERLLRQALALPVEAKRPLAPTWGRAEAFALLADICATTGKADEAKALREAGRSEFPEHPALSR